MPCLQVSHAAAAMTHCLADGACVPSAGSMFPASYNMSIINAQHGSWDRTPPIGYRVMVLNLNSDGLAQNYSALAEGWLLPNGTVWGKLAVSSLYLCLLRRMC